MTDSDFTPLPEHIRAVLEAFKEGIEGMDDAVQAIFEHPEFAAAWEAYQRTKPPKHGERREIGQRPMWWSAVEQKWKFEPIA